MMIKSFARKTLVHSLRAKRGQLRAFSIQTPEENPFTYDEKELQAFKEELEKPPKTLYAKIGVTAFGAVFSFPWMPGIELAAAAPIAFFGLMSVCFDYRVRTVVRDYYVSQQEEKSQMPQNVNNLIHDFIKAQDNLEEILEGERLVVFNYTLTEHSFANRKFYSRDEIFDAIQKRFEYRGEFLSRKKKIRGRINARVIYNSGRNYQIERLNLDFRKPVAMDFNYINDFEG